MDKCSPKQTSAGIWFWWHDDNNNFIRPLREDELKELGLKNGDFAMDTIKRVADLDNNG